MEPIGQYSLHGELLDRLRKMIADGELPPGEKIPERELCEQFGVSRTPLREAIKVLAAEGLVRLEPHRGAIVTTLTPAELDEHSPIMAAIEALSGELACEHITDEEIATIKGYHKELLAAFQARNLDDCITWGHKIHRAILTAARNPLLTTIYDTTSFRFDKRNIYSHLPRELFERGIVDHEEIMAALEARQGERLAALLRTHMERLLSVYRITLTAAKDDGAAV